MPSDRWQYFSKSDCREIREVANPLLLATRKPQYFAVGGFRVRPGMTIRDGFVILSIAKDPSLRSG